MTTSHCRIKSISHCSTTEGGHLDFHVRFDRHVEAPTPLNLHLSRDAHDGQRHWSPMRVSCDGGRSYQTHTPGHFNVPAGTAEVHVRVPTSHDHVTSGSARLHLCGEMNGDRTHGVGVIHDSCQDGTARVSCVSSARASEGESLLFNVTLAKPARAGAKVELELSDGTATGETDYSRNLQASFDGGKTWTAIAGSSVSMPAGACGFRVKVASIEDSVVEANETFTLKASSGSSSARGIGTICNDDSQVRVSSVSAAQADEGEPLTFTIGLNGAASAGTRVALQLANRTATGAEDYAQDGVKVSFDGGRTWTAVTAMQVDVPAGATHFKVQIGGLEDTKVEGNETFALQASTNGSSAEGIGTICDDDRAVTPRVTAVSSVRADEGDALTFAVSLSETSTTPTTVQLSLANGTALAGQDFASTGLQVSFDGGRTFSALAGSSVAVPAGAAGFQVKVSSIEDTLREGNETFTLQASANGGTATGTGTIVDDETGGACALKVNSVTGQDLVEGNHLVFKVNLSGGAEHTGHRPGEACPPENWTCTSGGGKGTIDLGDYKIECTEDRSVWTLVNKVTGVCTRIWGDPHVDLRNDGVNDFDFKNDMTMQLADGTRITVETVAWGLSGATLSSKLTITDWCNKNAMVVSGLGWDSDGTNNLKVEKFDGQGQALDLATDDGAFTLYEAANGNWNIFDGRPATQALVNDLEAGRLSAPCTAVKLELSAGTATLGADYQGKLEVSLDDGRTWTLVDATQLVNVPPGTTSLLARVPTIDDTGIENRETVTLTATAKAGFASAEGGILDNDAPVTAKITEIDSVQANEGDDLVFTVKLGEPAAAGAKVELTLADGSAKAGQDYASGNTQVSFDGGRTWSALTGTNASLPAGATSFKVKVGGLEDTAVEGAETFTLKAASGSSSATGTGTICDDDAPPPLAVTSVSSPSAPEGDVLVFDVRLSATAAVATEITLTLTSGSASAGADYRDSMEVSFDGGRTWVAVAGDKVTVPVGVAGYQVRVASLEDSTVEPDENFRLTATAPGGAASGTGTITNDDVEPTRVAAVNNVAADEGDDLVFSVTLGGPAVAGTRVELTLADQTATAGRDYSGANLQVSFDDGRTFSAITGTSVTVPAGATGFKVKVAGLEDTAFEGNETFTLKATNGASSATGTGTICDDDTPPIDPNTVHISGADRIVEGQPAYNFTVKLATAVTVDTWVTVKVGDGSAQRTGVEASAQEYVKDATTLNAWKGILPNATAGTDSLTKDFTIYGSDGRLVTGDTVQVLIRAGSSESAAFSVKAWQETQRVSQLGEAREGDEQFKLEVQTIGTQTFTPAPGANVTVVDAHIQRISPIIIDLDGDGVKTVSIDDSQARFDMDLDGTADRTGWAERDDGLLAVDSNQDGVINDRSELFGGNVGEGFAKLAGFDSNRDGRVDASDERFSELKIWRDADGDGQTDGGELISLDAAGLTSLRVEYETRAEEQNGNLLLERSSATFADGRSAEMADAYFSVDSGAAPRLADILGDARSDEIPMSGLVPDAGASVAATSSLASTKPADSAPDLASDGSVDLEQLMHKPQTSSDYS